MTRKGAFCQVLQTSGIFIIFIDTIMPRSQLQHFAFGHEHHGLFPHHLLLPTLRAIGDRLDAIEGRAEQFDAPFNREGGRTPNAYQIGTRIQNAIEMVNQLPAAHNVVRKRQLDAAIAERKTESLEDLEELEDELKKLDAATALTTKAAALTAAAKKANKLIGEAKESARLAAVAADKELEKTLKDLANKTFQTKADADASHEVLTDSDTAATVRHNKAVKAAQAALTQAQRKIGLQNKQLRLDIAEVEKKIVTLDGTTKEDLATALEEYSTSIVTIAKIKADVKKNNKDLKLQFAEIAAKSASSAITLFAKKAEKTFNDHVDEASTTFATFATKKKLRALREEGIELLAEYSKTDAVDEKDADVLKAASDAVGKALAAYAQNELVEKLDTQLNQAIDERVQEEAKKRKKNDSELSDATDALENALAAYSKKEEVEELDTNLNQAIEERVDELDTKLNQAIEKEAEKRKKNDSKLSDAIEAAL